MRTSARLHLALHPQRARGSSLFPNPFREHVHRSTVSRILIPGAIETHGRCRSGLVPSWMIVPQLPFGG